MESSEHTPGESMPVKRSSMGRVLFILSIPLLVVLGSAVWLYSYREPDSGGDDLQRQRAAAERLRADRTSFSSEFTDVDGDLLADRPTDPAKWLDPTPLVFSGPCSFTPEKEREVWQPLIDHMAKATGRKVDYLGFVFLEDQRKAMKEDRVHVAAFNTGAVPAAVNVAGFIPAFSPARFDGASTYDMLILVPADSPIRTPADLRQKRVALTATTSHSGYKAPLIVLRDEFGLTVNRDYEAPFSGSHERSIRGVANKLYDAAAVASETFDILKKRGEIKEDQLRVIYRSNTRQVTDAYGYAYNLNPDLVKKIREAFETFSFAGNSVGKNFEGADWVKFSPIDYKRDWEYPRAVDAKLRDWSVVSPK